MTGLRETALLLAHAAPPVTPSAALRSSIMDMIAAMPQLPAQHAPAPRRRHAARPAARATTRARRPRPPRGPEMEPERRPSRARSVLHATGAARARWFTRPAAILHRRRRGAAVLFFGGGALVRPSAVRARAGGHRLRVRRDHAGERRPATGRRRRHRRHGDAGLVERRSSARPSSSTALTSLPGDQTLRALVHRRQRRRPRPAPSTRRPTRPSRRCSRAR